MSFFKNLLLTFYNVLSVQFGLDLKKVFNCIINLPGFLFDYYNFRKIYKGKICFSPSLHDKNQEGGAAKGEYFWQDLVVARWIFKMKPNKHVDIGSRVDGFVAHVASFMEVEVFDVRPINSTIPGVKFVKADFMNPLSLPNNKTSGYCDSLSCLHAIEHFGLGRYGDPLSANGLIKAIGNMSKLLCVGGTFYISTPIGNERVMFNSHWIFSPQTILDECERNSLQIQKLFIFEKNKGIIEIHLNKSAIERLSLEEYNLGIFIFEKINS